MIKIYYKDKVHSSFFDVWWFRQTFYKDLDFKYNGNNYFQKLINYLKKEEDQ